MRAWGPTQLFEVSEWVDTVTTYLTHRNKWSQRDRAARPHQR